MESVIEKNKEAYYLALRRTQVTLSQGEVQWLPWLRFFLTALKRQKDHLEVKLAAQSAQERAGMPQYAADILDHLERHSRITTRAAAALTHAPVPTTKSRLKKMQSDGLIVAHGKGRGAFYTKA